jgi:hypothetical protein
MEFDLSGNLRPMIRIVLLIIMMCTPALAENAMRHVVVTPQSKEPVVTPPTQKTDVAPAAKPVVPKPLATDKIFIPYKDTKDWPELRAAMLITSDSELERVLSAVKAAPGEVPPSALFMIAKSLAEKNRMPEAAFYYYAAQLRASFDTIRFPIRAEVPPPVILKGKVPDQAQTVPTGPPKIINPHEQVDMLSRLAGESIGQWVMADPARLDKVITDVKAWDAATTYAYKLPYDVVFSQDEKTWPELLTTTRNDFFTRLTQISQALTSMRPTAPQATMPR